MTEEYTKKLLKLEIEEAKKEVKVCAATVKSLEKEYRKTSKVLKEKEEILEDLNKSLLKLEEEK